MKRLSTSLLIFILALLAVPDRAWAADVYLLTEQTIKDTQGSYTNPPSQHKFTNTSGTVYTYTFSNTEASGDIYFRIGVIGWNNNMQPANNNDPLKINGDKYSITNDCYGKDKLWKLTLDNNKYSSYTITVDISGNNRYVKVTGVESGTATTYNLVYLVDNTLKDQQLHTWLEGGATDEGITDWNSRPTIGSGDFATITTYNNTDYYTKTFSVDKTTADNYKQIGAKIGDTGKDLTSSGITSTWDKVQYIIVTSSGVTIVENSANMYTVTVSSADENMGTVSPASVSVNAATSQTVTATAKSGYVFDKWTATAGVTVADPSSPKTTVTATQPGTLIANFTRTEPIDPQLGTSSNGKAYYLATEENGANSIFGTKATKTTEGNTVTYSRILRFNDKGDGSYELNIPATISGNVWILEIDKQNKETTYRPVETVAVGSTNPADKGSINGSFGGSGTSTVFTLTDRGDVDGIYKIKLNLNTSGIPAKWTITHDPLTRVAYYLSTASMSSASPVYDQRANTTEVFSNRFIGTNYFNEDSNVDYYVISNILKGNNDEYVNSAKKFDNSVAANSNWNVITTVNKLLLLGNGGLAFSDQKPNNEFSPNELPMKSSDLLKGLCAVEYNPSNGDHDKAVETTHYGIRGQIIVRQGSSSTETTSMTIVGPLVAASVGETGWNWKYINTDETLTYGISSNNVMKYDETENCYTITIVTNNEQQGKTFRFVRNGNSNYTWNEDETVARIPYYDNSVTGSSAATVADPNYVNYGGSATSRDIDILFNRPAGKWTIKFYIVNEASSSDGSVKSKYYYTINAEDNFEVVIPSALKKVLRTYSYGSDVKPQDANVHVYVAHSFGPATGNDQYTDTKTGTVHLYEINYVPANTGVVLYCGKGTDAKTVTFVEANEYNVTDYAASKTDKTKLWKNSHEGAFNNDLEPVLARTYVDNSVKDESGNIIARNFCMSQFSKTKAAQDLSKDSYTDYIGFFRVKSDISANKAYLQYDTNIIDENAQIFGQDTDGEAVSGGAKLAMVFEGFEDDNVVTGISDNLSAKPVLTDDAYYNLQGMRVEKPVKGIYIHNGKKVVIK